MTLGASDDRREQMHRFVTRLQVLAGQFNDSSREELLDRFEELATEIPGASTRVEQLAIANLLQEAIQRLGRALNVMPARLLHFDTVDFRDAVCRLRAQHTACRSRYVTQFAEIVARRYAEADLSVTKVAAEMRLSPCYLTRILRQHTGYGFLWHLHTHRVARAKELLAASAMSVKEISGCIGYVRTSQFDRRFRASLGMTPSDYRRGIVGWKILDSTLPFSQR